MKKRILFGLGLFSLFFLLGGIYIIFTIERSTSTLDNLIRLHQVEMLREHLLMRVEKVQSDLALRTTQHARSAETVREHVRDMEKGAAVCFSCHHSAPVAEQLRELKSQVALYRDAIGRVVSRRTDARSLNGEEDSAFFIGEHLVAKTNSMISLAGARLEEKTHFTLKKIDSMKYILYVLVVGGPFLAAGLALVVIKGFTGPMRELLDATRRLKAGDLDHRIGALQDEFGEMAASFNEMALALRDHMSRIEESEKRYRMLFESAGDAIFVLEAEGEGAGNIVAANRAAEEMHGTNELLHINFRDLDTPDAAEAVGGWLERMLRGEWIKAEITHRKKDGTVFPVEISAGLLALKERTYILAFDRDLTERRRAEEEMQRAEQMRICGEFAAGLAHEIKNPLAGIKVSMEVLAEEAPLPQEDREVLVQVVAEIRRIETLIRDLLNYAKPPRPQLMSISLHNVLDATLSFVLKSPSFSAQGGAVRIEKAFSPVLPEITADPLQLQQVFLNLLLNAADALPEGGAITVKTALEGEGDRILVAISDTGKGVEERMREKIFQPFYTTKAKGTGLGLPISKRLVEQHGGTLQVENSENGGAVFKITLPVRKKGEEK
ncbi:MAG: ATP-binding protein [Thermodesulfovibrionales bacterium]